jgi:hypothetical protein
MDNGKRRNGCTSRCLKVGVLAFLGFCFLGLGRPGVAGDVQVVKGIVGTVAGNLIYLNGKSVTVSDVPVRNASGKELSFKEITSGEKVGLWYRRGRLISVIVYGPMVE